MANNEILESQDKVQPRPDSLVFADIVARSLSEDSNKGILRQPSETAFAAGGKLDLGQENPYEDNPSKLSENFQVYDNRDFSKSGDLLIAGLPHSDRGDQLNYVRENVNRIMTQGTRLDQALDTGRGTGWEGKAAAVEDFMNDTGWINFSGASDRRSYLNTVAADYNRSWGNTLIPAESRGLSERPAGYPKAYVDDQNRVQVILVTQPGGNTPVQYIRLGQ